MADAAGCATRNSTGELTVLVLVRGCAGVTDGSWRTRAAINADGGTPPGMGCARSVPLSIGCARVADGRASGPAAGLDLISSRTGVADAAGCATRNSTGELTVLVLVRGCAGVTDAAGCTTRNSTGELTVLVLVRGCAGVTDGSWRTRAAINADGGTQPPRRDVLRGCRSMRAGAATACSRTSRTAVPSSLRAGVQGVTGFATVCACTVWTRSARRPDASLCLRSMRAGVATDSGSRPRATSPR